MVDVYDDHKPSQRVAESFDRNAPAGCGSLQNDETLSDVFVADN